MKYNIDRQTLLWIITGTCNAKFKCSPRCRLARDLAHVMVTYSVTTSIKQWRKSAWNFGNEGVNSKGLARRRGRMWEDSPPRKGSETGLAPSGRNEFFT